MNTVTGKRATPFNADLVDSLQQPEKTLSPYAKQNQKKSRQPKMQTLNPRTLRNSMQTNAMISGMISGDHDLKPVTRFDAPKPNGKCYVARKSVWRYSTGDSIPSLHAPNEQVSLSFCHYLL